MSALSNTLAVLTAMFSPAILVSACGTLILTTSQRLSRSLDREREVAGLLRQNQRQNQLQSASPAPTADPAEHAYLVAQLHFAARRSRILQKVMTALHLTLSVFVASILCIGVAELVNSSAAWMIAALSVLGACLLLYASILLITEARLALADVAEETAYLTKAG